MPDQQDIEREPSIRDPKPIEVMFAAAGAFVVGALLIKGFAEADSFLENNETLREIVDAVGAIGRGASSIQG